jgi:glycosyl transferase family 2
MIPAASSTAPSGRPCYLLPLRWHTDSGAEELTAYLRHVAGTCEVVVVDGSPDPVFLSHHHAWAAFTRHLRPDPGLAYRNGKVNGVITGMRAAGGDRVIIADDDVRYDDQPLAHVLALLDDADIVIPQNYFSPLPWHAVWDSARSLINRAFGMDYPGTVAVRRSAFIRTGCYDGDVLFENLELIRTLRAGGARLAPAPQVYVRRLPPGARHFAGQRVRQAYDSLGQPTRLAAELALLPAIILAAVTRRYAGLGCGAAAAVALAEFGRRRHGATAVFSWRAPLLAPAWVAERSVCSWFALACRFRGGVGYAGQRLPRAATPVAVLRRRPRPLGPAWRMEAGPRVRTIAERLDR